MADVLVVAPLVTFEGDDWEETREFLTVSNASSTAEDDLDLECRCRRLLDNQNSTRTTSTTTPSRERLIDWHQPTKNRIWCRCFGGSMAPRNHRSTLLRDSTTANDAISDNLIWNHVPQNYNNADERNETESVNIEDSENSLCRDPQLSEDEESPGEAMDMSCLSLPGSSDDPVKSADEVISEIVEMMEDDMDTDLHFYSACPTKTTETLKTKLQNMKQTGDGLTACLREMPLEGLHGLQEELDCAIRDYSEVLLCQLVVREELGFQKELFNQFISLLLSIQKKRRMLDVDRRKGKTPAEQPTYRYLTTVIPYNNHQRAPDAELLQIYIKILSAIDEDNSKVPALLTDYILNVLCPKT